MVGSSSTQPGPPLAIGARMVAAGMGGCIAEMATIPLDTAKVRLQLQGESGGTMRYRGLLGTITTIVRQEGPKALYSGISAGLQRQMAFASVRVGLYDNVKGFYNKLLKDYFGKTSNPGVTLRIAAGVSTGGMAVLFAQPTDVVKIRMQAQGKGKGPARYTGAFNAYRTILKEEGVRRGLWKGCVPNVTRNAVVNTSEVVVYDIVKENILLYNLMKDRLPCHFVSALVAGFVTTVVASPIDVVKTRYMNSPPGKYAGVLACAMNMFKERGLLTFYKGFLPAYMRLGSWNIVMFVSYEQLKRLFHYVQVSDSSFIPATLPKYLSAHHDYELDHDIDQMFVKPIHIKLKREANKWEVVTGPEEVMVLRPTYIEWEKSEQLTDLNA